MKGGIILLRGGEAPSLTPPYVYGYHPFKPTDIEKVLPRGGVGLRGLLTTRCRKYIMADKK
jgi:hypothetical protein